MVTASDRNSDAGAARPAVYTPLYRQIRELIVAGMERGEWKPGELIPSEIELAARFQVSQGTVRKAVDELAAENLLLRRQGKGTFVATHHEPLAQHRFLRLVADGGTVPTTQSRFLECRRERAPAPMAAPLRLKIGAALLYVRRLLLLDGEPAVLDDIWLPGTAFKGLTAARLAGYRGPLYGLFETEFGVRMIRADERIRAVAAEPPAAALLGIASGAPLLQIERLSFTYGDRPVELRRSLCTTRGHHYHNELA